MTRVLVLVGLLFTCCWCTISNYKNIGKSLPKKLEPSGITYIPDTNQLVIVDDTGYICTLAVNGSKPKCTLIKGSYDWEDVTFSQRAYDLRQVVYAVEESGVSIHEISTITNKITRTWDLSDYIPTGKKGPEGLTFVPDQASPEGGYFYVGNQYDGSIYIFELSILSEGTDLRFFKSLTPSIDGATDISGTAPAYQTKLNPKGLFYYAWNQKLYIAVDDENRLYETDLNGKNARSWKFQKGMNEEGIYISGDSSSSTLYIADDSGTVWSATIKL